MKRKRNVDCYFNVYCLGTFFGHVCRTFKALAESHGIMLDVKVLIPWISAICLVLGFH